MKNIIFILLTGFLLISCRNGEYEESKGEGGQFGFSISRNNDFQPGVVNEKKTINLNLTTNYDFSSLKTFFKYSNNATGVLKLNGVTVNPNNEYQLTQKNNIFEYTGGSVGNHDLNFNYYNEKSISKNDVIKLVYDSAKVSFQGGQSANILFKGNISGNSTQLKLVGINRFFKASTTGETIKIWKVKYTLDFDTRNPYNNSITHWTRDFTEQLPANYNSSTYQTNFSDVFSTNDNLITTFQGINIIIENLKLKIEVINSTGNKKDVLINSSYSLVP